MKNLDKNIPNSDLLGAVAAFNSVSMQNKTQFEIISEGLSIYKRLPFCNGAALFLLNSDDFDFYYKASTVGVNEAEIKNIFRELALKEEVTNALSTGEITGIDQNSAAGQVSYCVIPLTVKTGVIGICLLIMQGSVSGYSGEFTACRIFSNYFAQLLYSLQLEEEILFLKESTEQKIALRTNDYVQSTNELKAILDSVQVGIIIVEKSTNQIADANKAATELIGISKEKIIGSQRNNYFLLTNLKTYSDDFVTNHEGLLKKNNGNLVPVIITVAGIRLGDKMYSIESFMDISERKRMEDALHKAHYELELKVEERTLELSSANKELQKQISERIKAEEEKLKLYWAVQQSPISIAITDLEGKIEYVNPQFTEMTGFEFEEVLGKDSFSLKSVDVPDATKKKINNSLIRGYKWHGEFKNRKKNGELFWVSSFISPLSNIQGELSNYLEVEEDITEKKKAEIELLTAKEKAEESDKLKSSLLSNMSHEFRTPLSGILGFAQILINEITDPLLSGMVKDIYSSGKRLMDTLNGVLNLSRFEVLQLSTDTCVINLPGLLEKIIVPYMDAAKRKSLEFNFEIVRRQLFTLVDSDLITQAVGYVIDNAVKFTEKGSVTVILDSAYDNGKKWAVIKIRDTGIGIDEKDHQLIFEAFRQASEGFSRNFEGIGLGLTLAEWIIYLMNGNITVESSLMNGATFTVWLPLAERYEPALME